MILRRTVRCLVAAWAFTLASLAIAPAAQAGNSQGTKPSPEFQALLNEIAGQFKVTAAELKDCDPAALEIAREAMNRLFVANAMAGPVVINAFENACKPVLDLFGFGIIGTTYSVSKCAWQYLDGTTDLKDFAACLGAEGVSVVVGKGFEALDLGNATSAGLNVPAGKGLDSLKGMIHKWHGAGSKTEFYLEEFGPDEGFPCNVRLVVRWVKPRNPVREEGHLSIFVYLSGCSCDRGFGYLANPIENGYVRYSVPVKFVKGPGGAPAWVLDSGHGRITIHAKCCSSARTTIRAYTTGGTPIHEPVGEPTTPRPRTGGTPTGGGTATAGTGRTTPTPAPPPPPPPPPLPPPWPSTPEEQLKLCPECVPIARDIAATRARLIEVQAKLGTLRKSLADNRAAQKTLGRQIAALQAQLSAQAGTGGTAVDTTTGVTTSAITQPDGSVLVTTTDANGHVIEQHSRPRRDLSKIREEKDRLQKQLDDLKSAEATLARRQTEAKAEFDRLQADLARLEKSLSACLERCRVRVRGGGSVAMIESVHNVVGNNPFNPTDPLGGGTTTTTPPPSTGCTAPRPNDDTRTQSCPAGQTGTIVQTRTYSCVGTSWVPGPFQTVSNTCTTPPPATCTTPQPPTETQTLSCPAGQTGSIVQSRSYTCQGTTWVPGPYTTVSNTCVAAPTGCATSFSSGTYSCSGSCGISSVTLNVASGSNSMTASTFGSNSGVGFSCSGASASSPSGTLTILGLPGHTCSLTGMSANSFGVFCSNTSGGTCNSSCSK